MTWKVVAASEIGTSHIAAGTVCEDCSLAQVTRTNSGVPVLSIFVSDGAGSAARGRSGAELAVSEASHFLASQLALEEFGIGAAVASNCVSAIRARIDAAANAEGLSARDFACTFLGVVSSPSETLVFQIGDGAVVLDVGEGLEIAIIPMTGEYANMTHFITDENANGVLQVKQYTGPILRVAVFSDGLQRLVLDMGTNKPHKPFFEKFFSVLSTSADGTEEELHSALCRFLVSDSVNERTDDDKSLALAVMIA